MLALGALVSCHWRLINSEVADEGGSLFCWCGRLLSLSIHPGEAHALLCLCVSVICMFVQVQAEACRMTENCFEKSQIWKDKKTN